jgi:hypothetical protein
MSRPAWKGTVVARPSVCRNCLWETLLAHLFESESLQNRGNLTWLKNRDVPHVRQRW